MYGSPLSYGHTELGCVLPFYGRTHAPPADAVVGANPHLMMRHMPPAVYALMQWVVSLFPEDHTVPNTSYCNHRRATEGRRGAPRELHLPRDDRLRGVQPRAPVQDSACGDIINDIYFLLRSFRYVTMIAAEMAQHQPVAPVSSVLY
eukprot:COSAG02_NODE_963_length_15604_cov_10.737117_13_plen_147_part_00